MSQYYYVGPDNQSHGPISPAQCAQCGINSQTLVCPVGGQQWIAAGSVAEFQPYLNPMPNMGYQQPQMQQPYQQPYQQQDYGTPPPTNMVWAVLCTIFCCLPFGIVAIIKASNVNSAWYSGNRELAVRNSKDAMKWAGYGVLASVIGIILYFVFIVGLIGASI